jgi:hypothetical protein
MYRLSDAKLSLNRPRNIDIIKMIRFRENPKASLQIKIYQFPFFMEREDDIFVHYFLVIYVTYILLLLLT